MGQGWTCWTKLNIKGIFFRVNGCKLDIALWNMKLCISLTHNILIMTFLSLWWQTCYIWIHDNKDIHHIAIRLVPSHLGLPSTNHLKAVLCNKKINKFLLWKIVVSSTLHIQYLRVLTISTIDRDTELMPTSHFFVICLFCVINKHLVEDKAKIHVTGIR